MRTVLLEMEKIKNLNSGLGQFCFHLGKALTENPHKEISANFYLPHSSGSMFGEKPHYIWTKKLHKFTGIKTAVDIFHCTHQESSYLPASKSAKIILTIHDLNFLEMPKSAIKRKMRLAKIQKLINRASAITCISEFTARRVKEELKIPSVPLEIIYNGNTLHRTSAANKPHFVPEGEFLFSIGIISPKKNFEVLIPVIARLNHYNLIIAGSKDHPYSKALMETARKYGVEKKIILAGHINEEEKYWLYENCKAFVFPSLAEGFGLPVIEAMSLGKPVFLSTNTSLPEIGGNEAYYFHSFDPEEMYQAFLKGMNDFSANPQKTIRITTHASRFTWENAAKKYQQLYLNLAL
ncbi:MAG: glycosyltransferase family 4 protein [Cytophagaceae bacterium]|nr:glycosyltransferase family 4 protein [Cytophagaceae bacterium]